MKVSNIYKNIPAGTGEEIIQKLVQNEKFFVERIVSRGHKSPEDFWYDQADDEFVLLLKGTADLEIFEKGVLRLTPGDYLIIPAHTKHRVSRTDTKVDTVWLTIHNKEGQGDFID